MLYFYQPANLNLQIHLTMRLVIRANTRQKELFLAKGFTADITLTWYQNGVPIPDADAYFDFLFEEEGPIFRVDGDCPVFINSVIETGNVLCPGAIRINAWNGFLEKEVLEIVIPEDRVVAEKAIHILQSLGWKHQPVPDIPGMISPRVIAMIVNEAYFGLGDHISTKTDIDTAMKLGTNYPMGPFEWSEKIGLQKIVALLKKLAETDSRYQVAPALEKEV